MESRMISRQPNNFLRGTLGLIPGGEALYRKLIETGAIEEAADWLEDQTEDLEKKHENRSDRGSIEEKK